MNDIVIGIDFGTTNSCLSYYNTTTKNVTVIENEQGNFTSPSVLFLDPDSSEILYGDSAKQLLNTTNQEYLPNIFSNLKRLIGKSQLDDSITPFFKHNKITLKDSEVIFDIKFNNDNKEFELQSLIMLYLNYLKSIICNHFAKPLDISFDIIITVPAYFNDQQRTIIKECCESIGLSVLRIINEPTAASLAYALEKYKTGDINEEFILTFDCGGGTTDISLLHLDYVDSIYEVKNTVGDNFLGGEDITLNLTNFIIQKLKLKNVNNKTFNKIKKQAEEAKKKLSFGKQTTIYLELQDKDYTLSISQSQFDEINREFYHKIRNLIYYVLDEYIQKTNVSNHNFDYSKINSVIFVGGTSRIPYFKTLFEDILPKAKINNIIDPDQTISIGAAIQGALLKELIDEDSGGDTLLMDIMPLSIGIETVGGIMTPIISRNSLLPVSRTQTFFNSHGFEESITINIYQGERKLVKDNMFLASFELTSELFKEYDKGEILITVHFEVDQDSIINAIATAKVSDKEITSNITVKKDSKMLDNKKLEEVLYYAEMNKLSDMELSNKILAKLELYDSFKYLLSVFHTHRDSVDNEFVMEELNELFNHTFNVITNYNEYTSNELKEIKQLFEKKWHSLLFGGDIILKDSEGQIMEFGGTVLEL